MDLDPKLYGKCEKCGRVRHIDGLRKIGLKRIYGTDYDRFECVSPCKVTYACGGHDADSLEDLAEGMMGDQE